MKFILRTGLRALRLVDRALEVLVFDMLLAKKRRALVLGVAAAAALGVMVLRVGGTSRAENHRGKGILYERPWLDHLPKDEHDSYQALIFNDEGFGVTLQATAYKGQWELFLFKAKDKKLQILFPHDKRRAETGYKISKIKHRTFDLELTLDNAPLGPKSYYSWKKHKHDASQPLRGLALERWLLPAKAAAAGLEWPEAP